MRFGICTKLQDAPAVRSAGWEFVEENIQTLFQGLLPDAEWTGLTRAERLGLADPVGQHARAGVAQDHRPADADLEKLRGYMTRVLERAAKTGTKMLVFGSGGARNVPDGFDRSIAKKQITDFASMSAGIAAKNGVTIVAEHLNRKECNIINSVAEAMEYVRAVNHPNFRCLVDSYHLWMEDEPIENVLANIAFIRHVHLADKDNRVAPGLSGTADYRPLFRILKDANYAGLVSVEALKFDIAKDGKSVLEFVKKQWSEA